MKGECAMSLELEFVSLVVRNLPNTTEAQKKAGIKSPLRVQKYLAGLADALRDTFVLKATIDRDMPGWKCEKPVGDDGEFEFTLQEFVTKDDNGFVTGDEMLKRGKDANSGLRHIEAIIREQDKIPVEMRGFILVSTEVWLAPGRGRYVWYACWVGGAWVLDYGCVGISINSRCRLVVPRKYQK